MRGLDRFMLLQRGMLLRVRFGCSLLRRLMAVFEVWGWAMSFGWSGSGEDKKNAIDVFWMRE